MAAPMICIGNAAASGDLTLVKKLLRNGADVNQRSKDGMTPLAVAAFWGYADIVELLLSSRADINACNKNTLWTPLHCATFQGHGKVIMKMMEYQPDVYLKDNQGRTAVDFASALDSIWPFFAAAGCKRTPKSELIKMDIVKKISMETDPTAISQSDLAHFSRPGSAYVMRSQPMRGEMTYLDTKMAMASVNGDVLAGTPEESTDSWERHRHTPSLSLWNH